MPTCTGPRSPILLRLVSTILQYSTVPWFEFGEGHYYVNIMCIVHSVYLSCDTCTSYRNDIPDPSRDDDRVTHPNTHLHRLLHPPTQPPSPAERPQAVGNSPAAPQRYMYLCLIWRWLCHFSIFRENAPQKMRLFSQDQPNAGLRTVVLCRGHVGRSNRRQAEFKDKPLACGPEHFTSSQSEKRITLLEYENRTAATFATRARMRRACVRETINSA
eukprot:COSAG02_NODE_377_length_23536_cov_12.651065_4_plen_216_part_00